VPPAVRELDVSILHSCSIDLRHQAEEVRQGGNIEHTIDAHAAAAVASGAADGAFMMAAPTVHDVERAATGATMPEKSLYFFPSCSLLVMNRSTIYSRPPLHTPVQAKIETVLARAKPELMHTALVRRTRR
jgi:hypothetical protein